MANKTIIAGIVGLLLVAGNLSITVQNRCAPIWTDSNKIAFDLNLVSQNNIDKPDTVSAPGLDIALALCNPITPAQIDPTWDCPNKPTDNMVYVKETDTNKCSPMTNSNSKLVQNLIKDDDDKITGITLTYENQDAAQDFSYKNKNLKVVINCNKDIDNSKIQWSVDDSDEKFIVFTTSAKAGCGHSLKDLVALFQNYKFIAAGIMFFLGLLFTFVGKRFFTITLTLTGFLIGFLSIAGTAYLFSAMQTADNKKIGAILIIAFLMGLLIGYLFYKFKVLTTMGAVGLLFFMIGNAVQKLYLARWVNQPWAVICILVVFVLIGVGFGYCYSKHCIMFSTSFGGAFLVVLAVSIATNTYSPPAQIAEMIKRGEKVIYPYVWGGLWVLLGIAGLAVQLHRHHKHGTEDDGTEVLGADSYGDYNKVYK